MTAVCLRSIHTVRTNCRLTFVVSILSLIAGLLTRAPPAFNQIVVEGAKISSRRCTVMMPIGKVTLLKLQIKKLLFEFLAKTFVLWCLRYTSKSSHTNICDMDTRLPPSAL